MKGLSGRVRSYYLPRQLDKIARIAKFLLRAVLTITEQSCSAWDDKAAVTVDLEQAFAKLAPASE
jgi:hypothetical protein